MQHSLQHQEELVFITSFLIHSSFSGWKGISFLLQKTSCIATARRPGLAVSQQKHSSANSNQILMVIESGKNRALD